MAGTAPVRVSHQPGPRGGMKSEAVPVARALGLGCRVVDVGRVGPPERRIAAQGLEPRVAVLVAETAVPFGHVPVPPPGFQVIHRVQSPARSTRQADEPGDADSAGETNLGGRNSRRFGYVKYWPTGVVFSVRLATVGHVTSLFSDLPGDGRCFAGSVWQHRPSGVSRSSGRWRLFLRCAAGARTLVRSRANAEHGLRWHSLLSKSPARATPVASDLWIGNPSGHRSTPLSAGRLRMPLRSNLMMSVARAVGKCQKQVPYSVASGT
jgi:hypothetical protein